MDGPIRTPVIPAGDDFDRLIEAGMDCARLNFSHGTHESHAQLAHRVRAAAVRARRPIAILADLCGPKMRIGQFAEGGVDLVVGAEFVLTTREVEGNEREVSVTYDALPRDVEPGDAILLDDGLLRLRVIETRDQEVITKVVDGGRLARPSLP